MQTNKPREKINTMVWLPTLALKKQRETKQATACSESFSVRPCYSDQSVCNVSFCNVAFLSLFKGPLRVSSPVEL